MVWEACFTMNNNWGYCANDHYYKPASMLIKKLVECVSKGGNMILNVGPDAKGKFPKESSAILAESDAGWIRTMTVSMDALRQQISRNRITDVSPEMETSIMSIFMRIH